MAVYALLQFFMAPIFGNLSDRYRAAAGAAAVAVRVRRGFPAHRPRHVDDRGCSSAARSPAYSARRSRPRAHTSATSATTPTARRTSASSARPGAAASRWGRPSAASWPSTSACARRSSWPRRWRSRTWRSDYSCCRSRCRPSGAASSSGRAPIRSARSRASRICPWWPGLLFAVFLYQMAHDSLPAVWMFYTQHKFGWGPAETG